MPDTPPTPPQTRQRFLSLKERKALATLLISETSWGTGEPRLAFGAMARAAEKFRKSREAISKFWKGMLERYEAEGILSGSPTKPRMGRQAIYSKKEVAEAVESLSYGQRQSIRGIAKELGISKSTIGRMIKEKDNDGKDVICRHSNSLLPLLLPEHKVARTLYAYSKLSRETGLYYAYDQDVHVDEKWFFITQHSYKCYVSANERDSNNLPVRRVSHKAHIDKVMFLCATARPRFDDNGQCTFDGKIGIWPIVEQVPARRASRARPAGTLVTKTLNVNKDLYRRYLLEKVIPAIKLKFPRGNKTVTIQQDGAKSHIAENDREFLEALDRIKGTWNISLLTQPARSPDLNHLDLSFFRSLQTEQWKREQAANVDGLIAQVQQAYNDFDPRKIEKGYVTLQAVLDEVILANGDNDYKKPHIKKDAYLRENGQLQWQLRASDNALESLIENDEMELAALLEEWEEGERVEEGGGLVAV
jgi:transposase